jgi:hypothetical protein
MAFGDSNISFGRTEVTTDVASLLAQLSPRIDGRLELAVCPVI